MDLRRIRNRQVTAAALVLLWLVAGGGEAAPVTYHIEPEQTRFAVLTRPAGALAWLGHPHLISAAAYSAELLVDEDRFNASTFRVTFPVSALVINDPKVVAEVLPRLRTLGVTVEVPRIAAADMTKLREHMLSPIQLDAVHYPRIEARVKALRSAAMTFAGQTFTGSADLALSLHGRTVTRVMPATILHGKGRLTATAVGKFRFTEFGIQPYQTAFGLLRNADDFLLYVELAAVKGEGE